MEKMKERVSFDQLSETLGFGKAFVICQDMLSTEQIKSFSFKNWQEVWREAVFMPISDPVAGELMELAIQKMAVTAKSFEEWLYVLRFSKRESATEKTAIEKIIEMGNFKDWTDTYSRETRAYANKRIRELAQERIRSFMTTNQGDFHQARKEVKIGK